MSNEIVTKRTGTQPTRPLPLIIAIIALAIAIVALFLPNPYQSQELSTRETSTLAQIQSTKVLRVGYEGYPPYTLKDPSTGRLSGYSVDLAEFIAREAGWKVEWIQTSPETKIPDLQSGKFDLMTEPIFRTIPRATQVSFTRPYAFFGYAAGIVRKGDSRFQRISDLNRQGVRVVVRQGYTDQTYAKDNLPNADVRALEVNDISQLFLEVISGKADIALADLEQSLSFSKEHESQVDAIFTNPAPAYVPAGFMLRQGDFSFYNFLNSAIDYMESNKVLEQLDQKYSVSTLRPSLSLD